MVQFRERPAGPLLGLGTSIVSFFPFYLGVSLLRFNARKKGTLIIKGLLGNLGAHSFRAKTGIMGLRIWFGLCHEWGPWAIHMGIEFVLWETRTEMLK